MDPTSRLKTKIEFNGFWNFGMLECWSFGVLEFRSFGSSEFGNFGVFGIVGFMGKHLVYVSLHFLAVCLISKMRLAHGPRKTFRKILSFKDFEILQMLEFWSLGVLEVLKVFWNWGHLEFWGF